MYDEFSYRLVAALISVDNVEIVAMGTTIFSRSYQFVALKKGVCYMFDLNDYLNPYSQDVLDKVERIKEWMIDDKCTIRQASKELCIPKSTIHLYIHTYIKEYYPEDYYSLQKILKFNKTYRFKRKDLWRS